MEEGPIVRHLGSQSVHIFAIGKISITGEAWPTAEKFTNRKLIGNSPECVQNLPSRCDQEFRLVVKETVTLGAGNGRRQRDSLGLKGGRPASGRRRSGSGFVKIY